MNKPIVQIIAGIVILCIGFFAGMEYKAYQLRKIFTDAASNIPALQQKDNTPTKAETLAEYVKNNNMKIIEKTIADEVTFATIKVKINKVDEQQTISSGYGSPKVAKEGTKFLVVNLDVTNITNAPFNFEANFNLVDNKERKFAPYGNSIGSIANYIDMRTLSPSIKENGNMVYELPADATSYSFVIEKGGTKEMYKVLLK